jgi:hypothetical protein
LLIPTYSAATANGYAEALFKRQDFLTANFGAHLASTQSVNSVETMRVGCFDLILQIAKSNFVAI